MNTGQYHQPSEVLFMASAMSGDPQYKLVPRGFYMSLIQEAFRELNMASMFSEKRVELDMPTETLTLALPDDCFDIENIYVYTGDKCVIGYNTRKVWWKRNYYTQGNGYIANDKGNNSNDPFYANHSLVDRTNGSDKSLIRYENSDNINNVLYYNLQMGNLMLSSSCRNAGNKVHIHYRGTGGKIEEAPIIPAYFKTAMEDYVTEAALRFRMANEPSTARAWQTLQMMYERRLDKNGMNGSWHTAIMKSKNMNKSQRAELSEYLSRGAWAIGQ
jgi:hypothetical protein